VKSSTSVKEHHWTTWRSSITSSRDAGSRQQGDLVHINNGYVRDGEIVPEELFVLQDITSVVRGKQASIPETLAGMRAMLRGTMPEIDIGPHCEDPYPCDFMDHCWQHVPEHSVFSLRGRGIDQWELYRQGVIKLQDVPLDSLNLMQRMQTSISWTGNRTRIRRRSGSSSRRSGIRHASSTSRRSGSAIPLFDGTRPYQQVPFQYSLHRIDAEGEQARHFEYLAQPGVDPRKEIAEKLLARSPRGRA